MFSTNIENSGFSAVGQDEMEQVNGGVEPVTLAVAFLVGAVIGGITGYTITKSQPK